MNIVKRFVRLLYTRNAQVLKTKSVSKWEFAARSLESATCATTRLVQCSHYSAIFTTYSIFIYTRMVSMYVCMYVQTVSTSGTSGWDLRFKIHSTVYLSITHSYSFCSLIKSTVSHCKSVAVIARPRSARGARSVIQACRVMSGS